MRIIAGSVRGRLLVTLKGEHTRPTLERVKEGVFSAIAPWLPGARVLDLFAGSGQMGLEALSRGAKSCVFVDNDRAALAVLDQNIAALGLGAQCRVVRGDAVSFLARRGEGFDILLMDPPYDRADVPKLPAMAAPLCAPGAILLCESAAGAAMPDRAGALEMYRQYRYGSVMVSRYHAPPADLSPLEGEI